MFDTHNHRHVTELREITKSVTINEHRAPTDESVRILEEMRQKALGSIIKTIEVKDNSLNGVVLYMQDDVVSQRMKYAFKFNLNGKEFTADGHIDASELHAASWYGSKAVEDKILKGLAALITEELAKQLNVTF